MVTMDMAASVLTDEWESSRMLAERLGVEPRTLSASTALQTLVVRRRALRRETPMGTRHRYEYRLP